MMIDRDFFEQVKEMSEFPAFKKTLSLTKNAIEKQGYLDLAVRYFVFRNVEYDQKSDVNEFLDDGIIELAEDGPLQGEEIEIFKDTFQLLADTFEGRAFKKWQKDDYKGKFLQSHFEVIAIGVAANITQIKCLDSPQDFLKKKTRRLIDEPVFKKNSGAGVRGTTRIQKLLPFGKKFFDPQ